MKSIERHIYSRKGYFYYRSALPRPYHNILPFREIVIALGSQDLGEARLMAARLHYDETKLLRTFHHDLRALPPHQSPEPLIGQFLGQIDALKGSVGYKLPDGFEGANGQGKRAANKASFSKIVQKYMEDCSADAAGTRFQKDATFALFREIMGDLPFADITTAEARHFKSCLMKIPTNAKKLLNITSFEGVDLDKITVGKPQHPMTINNRLSFFTALFNWAERAGYYHDKNPFSNLMIRGKQNLSSKRHPFKADEIKALFLCPVFTDCLGDKWSDRMQPGQQRIEDSMYWVPLIGLYSGIGALNGNIEQTFHCD